MKIVTTLRVIAVEERFRQKWISGAGSDAMFDRVSIGWCVLTDCGAFSVGAEKPEFVPGDEIVMTLEKR